MSPQSPDKDCRRKGGKKQINKKIQFRPPKRPAENQIHREKEKKRKKRDGEKKQGNKKA